VILIDTDVLIDFESYDFDPSKIYTASMLSRAELELGVNRAPNAIERQARQARLATLDTVIGWLPFDRDASVGYGVVAGGSTVLGARLRNKDALIAGHAYSLGLTILTRNVSDFAPFSAFVTVATPTLRALEA